MLPHSMEAGFTKPNGSRLKESGFGLGLCLALSCILALSFLSFKIYAQPESGLWSFWEQSDESGTEQIDHRIWGNILSEYLDAMHPSGISRFDYAAVDQEDHLVLKTYIQSLTTLDPRGFNKDEQFACWVNLYNALTVELVLSEYPVSSITEIKKHFLSFGPWDIEIAEIAGQKITLNDIEHRILRPIWHDHRIHFAVNCASLGCPSLSAEPYMASKLDEQLNEAAFEYLIHSSAVRFEGEQLVLSKIFDWYQEDFGESPEQMLKTLGNYLPMTKAEKLNKYRGKPKYEYDWQLNEP